MTSEPTSPRYPVFIVGSARSGTSAMVDALIAAGYYGFREGNFLPLAQRIASEIDRHFKVFDIRSAKILVGAVEKAAVKSQINAVFRNVVDSVHLQTPWFDKSGGAEMIRFLPTALHMWPTATIVFSKRRAIENVASRIKKFPTISFENHCLEWSRIMTAWRQVRDALPKTQFVEIDQYDMIHDPRGAASVLAELLGLDSAREQAVENKLRFTRPQESETGSAERDWTLDSTGWSEQQRELFLKHCAAEMTAFGYTLRVGYRADTARA